MESRIRSIFLKLVCSLVLMASTAISFAEEKDESIEVYESSPLIEPHILRLDLDEAEIDTENFEIGAHWGRISIEDFGVNDVLVATAAYHVTEDFFLEAAIGVSEHQEPLEDAFSGANTIDAGDEYLYYNLSLGINLFPGEVFIWKDWAFNSQIYLIGGVGVTEHILDMKDTTINIGIGYRLIVLDWLALHVDFRDHIFERDPILGETESSTVNNFEMRTGVSVFF
ncbi:MAG: outer membrane beta-barrel domain-containing protein [Pseudomonadales bacterium]|nr:outer membrane beta-barrel domain-containing protein [Pseudomonadales bacterium]